MASVGNLVVNLVANTSRFKKGLRGASGDVTRLRGAINAVGGPIVNTMGRIAASTGALVGIGGGLSALGFGIKLAADAEQAEVAFTTMTGSAQTAKRLMADIANFAASTPFQLPGLTDASRKLLAFGVPADQVIEQLRMVGDVSAGISAPIGEIAEVYGKAKVQGRLFAEDINQLTGRGIPIIGQLAKQFGVADSEVKKLVESGQVNFGHLQQAFVDLTGEGGKFQDMMAAQSQTISGLFSTLRDNVAMSLRDIAKTLINELDLKSVIANTIELTKQFNEWIVKTNAVQKSLQWAVETLGFFADSWQVLHTAFKATQVGISGGITMLVGSLAALGVMLENIINLIPGMNVSFSKTAVDMAQSLDQLTRQQLAQVEDMQKQEWHSQKVNAFFANLKKKQDEAANGAANLANDTGISTNAVANVLAPEVIAAQKVQERIDWITQDGEKILQESMKKKPIVSQDNTPKKQEKQLAGAISGFESGAFLSRLVAAQQKSGKTTEDKQLAVAKQSDDKLKTMGDILRKIEEKEAPVLMAMGT